LSGELLDLCVGIIVLVKYNSLGFGWNRGFGAVFFLYHFLKIIKTMCWSNAANQSNIWR
jgi:hypothetical protein